MNVDESFQNDISRVQRIPAVPKILDVVCRITGMGFAAVARVTEDRWIACEVLDNVDFGLPAGGELKVETTLCHEIRQHREPVIIDNVAEDTVYAQHHTPRIYGLQSYISVPITLADGRFFGALCAIDKKPRNLNDKGILGTFQLFADMIAYHLDAEERLAAGESNLQDAIADTELREQFIAVLGHDLRNPLAAIEGGRMMLQKQHDDPKSTRILRLMGESVQRMSGLIDNLMDFARGRLGGGIAIEKVSGTRIEPLLAQVINEIKTAHPERDILIRLDLVQAVEVDHARIAQMFSNLLGNAVTHGAHDRPIAVKAEVVDGQFELSVSNGGDPIPPATIERLFQPFYRGGTKTNMQGLGLGLYIASQIAQAHGGRLDVKSDENETRFSFRMPVAS